MTKRKQQPKNTHGGKRAGAGRKRSTDPMVTYQVRVRQAQVDLLKTWGGGDLSTGLRWLIDIAQTVIRKATMDDYRHLNRLV